MLGSYKTTKTQVERQKNQMANIRLYHGDCLEVMQTLINEDVKVDLILTDPPYGTTQCQWE